MSEQVGIENLEKCLDIAAKNLILGIEIGKDGLNEADLVKVPQLFENIKELIEFIADKPDLLKEIKDIDPMEGFKLLQRSYDHYKAIKEV